MGKGLNRPFDQPRSPARKTAYTTFGLKALNLVLFGALLAAGCSRAPAPSPPSADVEASLIAATPISLKDCRFQLTVADKSGNPLIMDHVVADLTMTTMDMPPNPVDLRAAGPGKYVGVGTFTMSGRWAVVATGRLHGVAVRIGTFPLSVKD